MRFLVRLRPDEESRVLHGDGYTRPTASQLQALANVNRIHVAKCVGSIRRSLPDAVSIRPFSNLGYVVLTCPPEYPAEQIKERVRQACKDVESITDDFALEGTGAELNSELGATVDAELRGTNHT